MPHIVIVGAGISGLAAAYRLQQLLPAADITVIEENPRPGGTVWTVEDQGFRFEAGPNGFLDTKPSTLALARELGLGDRLIAADENAARNRYLFLGDRLRLLPGSLSTFLGSDLLSWRGKAALLLERFRPRGPAERDESIAAFARRRGGREVADVLADALVTGIFAGDPELLSLPASFPRLAALEREFGSVLGGMARSARRRRAEAAARGEAYQRTGRLWSFREGLGLLIDTLAARLRTPPVLGAAVRAVGRATAEEGGPAWRVAAADGRHWRADAVLLACPAYRQAALLADLDATLAEHIGTIPYNRVTVAALGYHRRDIPVSLNGFGFIAPQRLRRDLLGVQWCSSLYPNRAPADMVLLRALCGGWHRPDAAAWEEPRLLEALRAELRRAMNITAAPVFARVVRWERAIPQYHLGHLARLGVLEERLTRHAGLFLGGNAYRGVALNDCTEQAQVLAEKMRGYLDGTGKQG
jgi:oxygen-dependent protoporphyrinogen oxidase